MLLIKIKGWEIKREKISFVLSIYDLWFYHFTDIYFKKIKMFY